VRNGNTPLTARTKLRVHREDLVAERAEVWMIEVRPDVVAAVEGTLSPCPSSASVSI
jgi:hypothetical protein